MAGYFFLGIALLLSLLLIARAVVGADPHALAKGMRYGGGAAALGLAIFLILTDRWPFALAALGAALPMLMRWRAARERARSARGPTPGQRTEVATATLRMTLDHDSGAMSGSVLKGRHAGAELASLDRAALLALLAECRAGDPPSVALLESYLERRFGADWAEEDAQADSGAEGARAAQGSAQMTRHEALEILGLAEGATPAQIKEAYRRLMAKLHPDAGGSPYLAVKLNQAKALLLGD